jgi:hypothetical protein
MMMKIHNNFYIGIEKHLETRRRTVKNKKLEEYYDKKFYPIAIVTKNNNLVCYAKEINEFLELLGSFISNQLQPKKYYGFSYKDEGGGKGKLIIKEIKDTNKTFPYLGLKIDNKEDYLLEKYDCRIIIANAKQILSKCTLQEFI